VSRNFSTVAKPGRFITTLRTDCQRFNAGLAVSCVT